MKNNPTIYKRFGDTIVRNEAKIYFWLMISQSIIFIAIGLWLIVSSFMQTQSAQPAPQAGIGFEGRLRFETRRETALHNGENAEGD